MSRKPNRVWGVVGLSLVVLAFSITQPFLLAGAPLALLLIAFGPRNAPAAIIVGMVVAMLFLGEKGDLWWFERGWSLVLAGGFVWIVGLRNDWSFSAQALAAVTFASLTLAVIMVASPRVWLELDASMTARSVQAVDATVELFGGVDDRVRTLMSRVAALQVVIFPALLGVSSMAALGLASLISRIIGGQASPRVGPFRGFRFNDHLIWLWLAGLALVLAPVGQIAERVGSNAVFFMGALYVLRGLAVVATFFEGVSLLTAVLGGLIVVLLTPVLIVVLAFALALGLGDTWLNMRERIRVDRAGE